MALVLEVQLSSVLFATGMAIFAHLVNSYSSYIKSKVLNWRLPDPEEIRNLRDSISELKKEQRTLNVIDDFVKHSRIGREIVQKDKAFQQQNRNMKSRRRRFGFKVNLALYALQACIHVSTAVVLWQQALVKLNRELFWGPLLWCLSLPNLDIGSVSVPVWMVISRQSLRFLSFRISKLFI